MMSVLERRIESVDQRLILVAPSGTPVPDSFGNVVVDPARHRRHVREVQRLRGQVYLADGAVRRAQLSAGGLHQTPQDANSWHLLLFREQRRLSSCMWYRLHENPGFEQLRVRNSPLEDPTGWGSALRRAVEAELASAQRAKLGYAEIGGWAIAKESRRSCEAFMLLMATYGLSRVLGGALGITTATVRHSSSTLLKRVGGAPLDVDGRTLPPYFDPNYGCDMEILRFDSRQPNPKFAGFVELLARKLTRIPVIAAQSAAALYPSNPHAHLEAWAATRPFAVRVPQPVVMNPQKPVCLPRT